MSMDTDALTSANRSRHISDLKGRDMVQKKFWPTIKSIQHTQVKKSLTKIDGHRVTDIFTYGQSEKWMLPWPKSESTIKPSCILKEKKNKILILHTWYCLSRSLSVSITLFIISLLVFPTVSAAAITLCFYE